MTPEELQMLIDHHYSVAIAEKNMGNENEYWFHKGKRDAYIHVLETMYPEINDRVFPFDEKEHEKTIAYILSMYEK